jgi:signal transduction histidine kinase
MGWRNGAAPAPWRYVFALAVFLVALAARFAMADMLPPRGFPFLTFFPAVLLTAYLAGFGPGLLVAALSTWAAWAFFLGPRVALSEMAHSDLIALVFFAVILIIDCLVIEAMNTAMRNLRITGDKLRLSEETLVARQQELSNANRQKDVFLAMLAHELRNPLAPILSAAQLIGMRSKNDEHVAHAAAVVTRQCLQLSRLVDDLLDASRILSGKLTLQKAPVDLRDIVADALETSRPMIDKSQSRFTVDMTTLPLPLQADGTRIAQCIANLLHNAFKFSAGAGEIHLRVARLSDREVAVTVSDTGRGISAEMLPKLFEMFSQEGSSGRDGNSGLGIGLALAHDLVTRHGGRLSAHSEGLGKGARFEIVLPLAPDR